jgi:hypothetical protein
LFASFDDRMAMALAAHLGLSANDGSTWAWLEKIRGVPISEGLELWQAAAMAGTEGQVKRGGGPGRHGCRAA